MTPVISTSGQFLIAMPSLAESFFDHALIFMLEHNEDGAIGLIVNQPIDLTTDEVLTQIDADYTGTQNPELVLCGGPVEMHRGFVIHKYNDAHQWENQSTLMDNIAVTTSADILEALAQGEDIGEHLIVLGYAGWGPGQLEDEMADNAWLSLNASTDILFDTASDKRLDTVIKTLGIDYAQLTNDAGHA